MHAKKLREDDITGLVTSSDNKTAIIAALHWHGNQLENEKWEDQKQLGEGQ